MQVLILRTNDLINSTVHKLEKPMEFDAVGWLDSEVDYG